MLKLNSYSPFRRMNNPNKRLADVAKKQTTDRASKLASSLLPPPPAAATQTLAEPAPEIAQEAPPAPAAEEKPVEVATSTAPTATKDEKDEPRERRPRTKTAAPSLADVEQMLKQPSPEGIRCNKPMMLSDRHHDWLRELSFTQKKPMTVLLYNLLEPMYLTYQRQKEKGE